jgi:putative ABC transport system substrate-binding protein
MVRLAALRPRHHGGIERVSNFPTLRWTTNNVEFDAGSGCRGDSFVSFWRIRILGLALLLAAIQSDEAAAQTMSVLGYVAAKNANPKRLEVFKQGLAELGYFEGRNIQIEYREAVLDAEYHGIMVDLARRKVDVILAANVAGTVAAAKATDFIPIVMLAVFDPVGIGVVKSLERPGTNVTGTTMYAPQLIGERLRILKRIAPTLDKVAMALNGNNVNNASQFELLRLEAERIGVAVASLDIRKPEDVDPAFDKALAFGAKGLVNAVDTFINSRRYALAAGAAKHRLPFVYSDVEYVLAGGLMALGPGHYEGYYGAARYVDKILRGVNPADLPVAGPTEFTVSANRTAFNNLGLSLPADLVARVNEWID